MPDKLRIYLTVPNGKAWIHKKVHFAVIKILFDGRYEIRHDCPTHTPYVENLHACMNDFLDIGGEDYWMSIDADNPPLSNPLDLVDMGYDIVGFPTPVWHSAVPGDRPWYYNALREVDDGFKPVDMVKGWQEVDAIGFGCFLISKKVMTVMRYEQPFMREWGKDGRTTCGVDYAFCKRARKHGFRIWVHSDYTCEHFNELPIREVALRFRQMYKGLE